MGIIKLGAVVFASVVVGSRIGVAVLNKTTGDGEHASEAVLAAKATGIVVSFVILSLVTARL